MHHSFWAWLFIIGISTTSAQAIELRRGPYLLNQRPDGITVRWRTNDAVRHTAVVRYAETPYAFTKAVEATELPQHFPGYQEWEVVFTGLAPDTTYYYMIDVDQVTLVGADMHHYFRTAPLPQASRPLRFWLFGDSGSNRPRQGEIDAVLKMSGPSGPVKVRNGFRRFNGSQTLDGIILLGDNAYPFGTDGQYQTAFFNVYADELRHTPLWPCIGNHDMDWAYRYIFFTTPVPAGDLSGPGHRYYYAADVGNVHIVVLDAWKSWWEVTTDPNHIPWQKQSEWLDADLESTDQDWIIVVCHFPIYCDGNYNSDTNTPLVILREVLVPLLDRHGVDLYLAGHDHTYQRSYLIHGHTGASDTFSPVQHLKSPYDGRETPIRKSSGPGSGTVYIVSGTGAGTRTVGKFAHPAMVPFMTSAGEKRGIGTPGSLLLEIDGLRLQGWQIGADGQTIDHFTIEKETQKRESKAEPGTRPP